jgi:hypothetical protein
MDFPLASLRLRQLRLRVELVRWQIALLHRGTEVDGQPSISTSARPSNSPPEHCRPVVEQTERSAKASINRPRTFPAIEAMPTIDEMPTIDDLKTLAARVHACRSMKLTP